MVIVKTHVTEKTVPRAWHSPHRHPLWSGLTCFNASYTGTFPCQLCLLVLATYPFGGLFLDPSFSISCLCEFPLLSVSPSPFVLISYIHTILPWTSNTQSLVQTPSLHIYPRAPSVLLNSSIRITVLTGEPDHTEQLNQLSASNFQKISFFQHNASLHSYRVLPRCSCSGSELWSRVREPDMCCRKLL